MNRSVSKWLSVFLISLSVLGPALVLAQVVDTHEHSAEEELARSEDLKQEVDTLNAQVEVRQKRIQEIDSLVTKYKTRIDDQQKLTQSLQNTVALLDNRIQEKQLAVERAKNQAEVTGLEIQNTGIQIQLEQQRISKRQEALSELLRQIQEAEQVSVYDVLLTRKSLSEFFAHVDELRRLEQELTLATQSVKDAKDQLVQKKGALETQKLVLLDQQRALQKEKLNLEGERAAKISILDETQNNEDQFRRILYELRQEQQSTADDVIGLEDRLKDQLQRVDDALARGDVLLSWPLKPPRGISAYFHDPSYPFRGMFEHPGVDLPTNVGTPVKAAASGYIAFTRVGKQYGNYIMIIHPGGIATVYGHLSKFNVQPDQYVDRGEVIGYSGGRPGDKGAGLSTGPHLHFEVRQNGIPTDPLQFLPELSE